MIRSFDDQVSAVTGVAEPVSLSRWDPSLWLVTIREPPLPSSRAIARYRPLGEKAAALGDVPSSTGVPELGNSTIAPGTSGACEIEPSGVGVAPGAGVAVSEGDGEAVADWG